MIRDEEYGWMWLDRLPVWSAFVLIVRPCPVLVSDFATVGVRVRV